MARKAEVPVEVPLADAALRLGVSWDRAWRFLLVGRLEGRKVGRRWLVSAESVERLRHALAEVERLGLSRGQLTPAARDA